MTKQMTAEQLDEYFDNGGDITELIDESSVVMPNAKTKRVNVDFPQWMLDEIDEQAQLLAINRQAIIKMWLKERLDKEHGRLAS